MLVGGVKPCTRAWYDGAFMKLRRFRRTRRNATTASSASGIRTDGTVISTSSIRRGLWVGNTDAGSVDDTDATIDIDVDGEGVSEAGIGGVGVDEELFKGDELGNDGFEVDSARVWPGVTVSVLLELVGDAGGVEELPEAELVEFSDALDRLEVVLVVYDEELVGECSPRRCAKRASHMGDMSPSARSRPRKRAQR